MTIMLTPVNIIEYIREMKITEPVDMEISSHLNMRIAPKVRYLTELAARARGVTMTEYIEAALQESFRSIYLEGENDPNGNLSLKERLERFSPPIGSLAHYADALWDENPGKRLALRALLPPLMSPEERKVWDYIMDHDAYSEKSGVGRKPKYSAIAKDWPLIKKEAVRAKAKTKGGK
jgi:hypothetical protein